MATDGTNQAGRLTRLEEHAAFLERKVDELSAEVAEMNRRSQEMRKRLDELERRAQAIGNEEDRDQE
jgi:uncharacterized coiled-coil protein SlyX